MADAALQFLVTEIFRIGGLTTEAEKLKGFLDTIQQLLKDVDMSNIGSEDAKSWVEALEDVASYADRVLDELYYHSLSKKIEALKEKVLSCFSSSDHALRPRQMALKIEEINRRLDSLTTMACQLSLPTLPTLLNTSAYETHPFTTDPIFIGDDVVLEIVEMLKPSTKTANERVSILSIVGMAGLGKTELTRKVFNHSMIETRFGSLIWVHVSQIFDPIILFMKILSTLTLQTPTHDGVESGEVIRERLQEALKDKTYLLVLDDVWNQDVHKWEDFINSLSEVTSTMGNNIIITTRNEKVASIVNPFHIHVLEGLSEIECWSIIKANAFGPRDYPSEYETIGENIARKCCGLPLAAKVVGLVLRRTPIENWISIEWNWLLEDELERLFILNTLRSSFDNLSSRPLQKCFVYCSIFPKGHRILKQTIIELWMAEKFLKTDDMESEGNDYFNALLHNSLLLAAERDDHGNVESCVMHDLVHDLGTYFLGGGAYYINKRGYLIHRVGVSDPIPKEKETFMSTLTVQGEITDPTMFSSFKHLKVLTLDCDRVTELPSSIIKLRYLRNLNISNTRIEKLPDWIRELYFLQTLNALTESLRELPSTFKYLIKLRHLHIRSCVKLPPEIGLLTDLRALKFSAGNKIKGYRIEELRGLKNLKQLTIDNLEKVQDEEEAKKAGLHEKQNLIALQLEWDVSREGKTNDMSVLEGLQPYKNLEKLKIKGFGGKKFASWSEKMSVRDGAQGSRVPLNNLIQLTLSKCRECKEIPMLGHLPNLKYLHLWTLCSVEVINSSFYGIDGYSGVIFPALESLLVSDMPELRELTAKKEFPNESPVKIFPRLQSLKIFHCKKLECLPSWLFYEARGLLELDIRHCSMLTELPDGLHALNSLDSMTIKGCEKLKSVEYPQGSSTSLRSLEICNCQNLMAMAESFEAPLLKKVSMVELNRLKSLPRFLDCLAKSPLLRELTIVGVPKFISTSVAETWSFLYLRKLEIDVSREGSSETSEAIMKTVDGFLKGCCLSLGELTLTGLEIWECLPESIQNLTAVSCLELENFGVEELPPWFGNLSSLTRLCLSNCAKLNNLPSKDAMQRLTKLQELHICDCSELRIESERHKIFHVRNIYVNGHPI